MSKSNADPKVSIILPTYNRAKYIIETIESVRNQTYQNWELLVIDDVSQDNTGDLVKQINDERVQLFRTERRLGVTGTRNEGVRKANSDLIAFIDSDDLWDTTKLEKQVDALQQYPTAGYSVTGGFNFRNQLEPVDYFYKQRNGIRYDNLFISFFRSEVSVTTPSLVFRKQCLSTTGFFDEGKTFADVDFILRLARHFNGIILYEPLLFRRLHDSNISSAGWMEGYVEGIELIHTYAKVLPSRLVSDALFRLYINFGEDCLSHKKRWKGIRNFFLAWRNKPGSIIPLKKAGKAILKWKANK
jgi:glycosyltransferase involved in cell wall biosynthesis